jgi:hypothetical protein
MRWVCFAMGIVWVLVGCKHPEALPSERVYMAAIAPAHERSLGPLADHIPEPERGPENVVTHNPTHGPEHGPEGQPENVPPEQMPMKPGEGPRPDGDPNDGLAFKPKVATRQAPKVLGRIGPDDLPTSEHLWKRAVKWAPPAPAYKVVLGDVWVAYHENGNSVRWQGEIPVRHGSGLIGGTCFVRQGRITYLCTEEERAQVEREAFLARVLYWHGLMDSANVDVRSPTELVVSSTDKKHMVIARIDEKSGRLRTLSSGASPRIENISSLEWIAKPEPMLWESLESVAHGATERTESSPFWGLCGDAMGSISGVIQKIESLKARVESRGAELDRRVGMLIEKQAPDGWRVCVPITQEVDGASRFRAKPVGRIWHQGGVDTVMEQKAALDDWLRRNGLMVLPKASVRIRLFDLNRLGAPREPLCALEIGLESPQ